MKKNTLPKKEKLKSKKQIDALFTENTNEKNYPIKIIYRKIDKKNNHKIGVSTPKRLFKKAVDRNRIKRLLREIIRTNKNILPREYSLSLMVIYTGRKLPKQKDLKGKIISIFEKIKEKNNLKL